MEVMAKEFKRIDASTFEAVDAKKAIAVIVQLEHCKKAVLGDPERCALVLAAKSQHKFVEFIVHRTIAYARREGDPKRTRYQHSASTRRFIERLDTGDFSAISNGGRAFKFYPPKSSIRLDHLRSDAFKKVRKVSDKARRGKIKRPYRLPDPKTLAGVRNRFGIRSEE
jgi:hypothetical protein